MARKKFLNRIRDLVRQSVFVLACWNVFGTKRRFAMCSRLLIRRAVPLAILSVAVSLPVSGRTETTANEALFGYFDSKPLSASASDTHSRDEGMTLVSLDHRNLESNLLALSSNQMAVISLYWLLFEGALDLRVVNESEWTAVCDLINRYRHKVVAVFVVDEPLVRAFGHASRALTVEEIKTAQATLETVVARVHERVVDMDVWLILSPVHVKAARSMSFSFADAIGFSCYWQLSQCTEQGDLEELHLILDESGSAPISRLQIVPAFLRGASTDARFGVERAVEEMNEFDPTGRAFVAHIFFLWESYDRISGERITGTVDSPDLLKAVRRYVDRWSEVDIW